MTLRTRLAVPSLLALVPLVLAGCASAASSASVAPVAATSSAANDGAVPATPAATGPGTGRGSAVPSAPGEGIDGDYSATSLGPTDTITAKGLPSVHFRINTKKPVYFITIDDGYAKQKAAVDYIRSRRLPVTTFLTNAAVGGNYAYFKGVSAYDAVQNHTMTHKALSKASTDRAFEICRAQQVYAGKFGTRPWILRPPYGAGMYGHNSAAQRNRILSTAASCGIKHIAMWNVTVSASGSIAFAHSGNRLRAGDIVLLHFEGNVAANLKKVVALGKASGLSPASLSAVLAR